MLETCVFGRSGRKEYGQGSIKVVSSITINSNLAALNAQRRLAQSTSSLRDSFTRLSSGLRINRGGDDAAGLAIASGLDVDARVFNQAVRNLNDGIGMLSIAEGALTELSGITQRQLELAEQASNGVLSLEQRRALDAEANALVDEFNRIVESTTFNDRILLDVGQSGTATRLQGGYGEDGGLEVQLGEALSRAVGLGSFESPVSFSDSNAVRAVELGDFNSDGVLDVAAFRDDSGELWLFLGNGDGTLKAPTDHEFSMDQARHSASGDFNNDGLLDLAAVDLGSSDHGVGVLLSNGNGTFKIQASFSTFTESRGIEVGDLDRDGNIDIVTTALNGFSFQVNLGNGDGTFKGVISIATGDDPYAVDLADLNNDGILDVVTTDRNDDAISIRLGLGDGTFGARTSMSTESSPRHLDMEDVNHDGFADIIVANRGADSLGVYIGRGDGSFDTVVTYTTDAGPNRVIAADFNGDGVLDLSSSNRDDDNTSILFGNGDGTFKAKISSAVTDSGSSNHAAGDLNGDGVLDQVFATNDGNSMVVLIANTKNVSTVGQLNLLTREGALEALPLLREQLNRVTSEKATIGAAQSRLSTATNNLRISVENIRSAASQITDVDVAEETAQLVRNQILQQAGAAVLGQANQAPQLALVLLG